MIDETAKNKTRSVCEHVRKGARSDTYGGWGREQKMR